MIPRECIHIITSQQNFLFIFIINCKMFRDILIVESCSQISSLASSGEQEEEELEQRKTFRKLKLQNIKGQIEQCTAGRQRKQQRLLCYFLHLAFPLATSAINGYFFLGISSEEDMNKFTIVSLGLVAFGLFISLGASYSMATWREVIKLYILLDSLVPGVIAGIITFYCLLIFSLTDKWSLPCLAVAFVVYMLYLGGTLRLLIAFALWSTWQIVTYKISIMLCGLSYFYVAFVFMSGTHRNTFCSQPSLETLYRDLLYLYFFGMVEICFQCYRRLSYFDQTDGLKFNYHFSNESQDEHKLIAMEEYNNLAHEIKREELYDIIATKRRVSSKKLLTKQINKFAVIVNVE